MRIGEGRFALLSDEGGGARLRTHHLRLFDEETRRNLPKVGRSAALVWKNEIAPRVPFVRLSAALDERDFHTTHGREV